MGDTDPALALTTYKNYLVALWYFIESAHRGPGGRFKRLAQRQMALKGVAALKPSSSYKRSEVRAVLFNAWHTEAVLGLPREFGDSGLIRFTNQWAPVQAYYAVYSLIRAWGLVDGSEINNHLAARKAISNLMTSRILAPTPWVLACAGGHTLSEVEHMNFATRPADLNPLMTPPGSYLEEAWYSKVLRTTRKFFLDGMEGKWKADNRTKSGKPYKRIPTAQRERIRNRLHPTTVFDFLYRLRVRSNYRDVDDFVSGQLSDGDAQAYFRSLLYFTRASMQVIECLVRLRMGRTQFDEIAGEFLASPTRSAYSFLRSRLEAVQAASA